MVTVALLGIVLQRALKDLRWLSTVHARPMPGFMLTAIYFDGDHCWPFTKYTKIPTCHTPINNDAGHPVQYGGHCLLPLSVVCMYVFSFEGIGLVLPVENSFTKGY
jgi:hypothetical protein